MSILHPSSLKGVLSDVVVIVALSGLAGIAWNHTLLLNAWRGKAVAAGNAAAQTGEAAVSLPLGLMQVKDLHDRHEALLVDARDAETYGKGHIEGAVSFPLARADRDLPAFLLKTPPATTLIVYCNGFDCHDSRSLAEKLLKSGYSTVFIFEGGFPEWRDAGYPVTTQ